MRISFRPLLLIVFSVLLLPLTAGKHLFYSVTTVVVALLAALVSAGSVLYMVTSASMVG